MDKQYQEVFHKDDRNKKGTQKAKKRTNVRETRIRNQKILNRQNQKEVIIQIQTPLVQRNINGKITKQERFKIRQAQRKQQDEQGQKIIMKGSKKIKRS